ncbi:MAG: type II secretion system protein [Chloroflexi bacterium]|nr:type II secretion system protein [Chloroflexota bacterium]
MFAKDPKNQAGFTIVEVMIVLAIAGLVLAIVFIAVPALQRNSRNTQRRSDLANLRAQVQTWTSNNGGKIPNAATATDALADIVNSAGWGHYSGNGPHPLHSVMSRTSVTTPANCGSGVWTDAGSPPDGIVQASECNPMSSFVAASTVTTPGDTPEYTIGYAFELDPGAAPEFLYPDRQEIHVFGGYACNKDILNGGNDTDDSGPSKYDINDLVDSNARAVAFVYQIEGEDNARCEDNV